MKTIFRVAALALVTVALGAAASTSTFAQEACTFEMQQKLYGTWKEKTKSNVPAEIRIGVEAGKEFVAKCATGQDAVVKHLNTNIPIQAERADKLELIERFNNSTKDRKTYNADEAFSSGKALVAKDPDLAFDIGIALALVGFENSLKTPPVDKYNAETINFAKKAISDVEGGKTSNAFGAYSWSTVVIDAQKKTDAAKSKQKTLASMNYIIGSVMYYNQKSEKDALPFFYKATQIDSDVKNRPDIYQAIGGWYLKEIVRMEAERQAIITSNNNQDNEQSLALLALMKGFADRGINAFGKAHKIAKESKTPQPDYIKSLYEKLQGLYQVRFEKTEGLDAYIATASNQPLPDPTTPVTPVVETPATTPTTTGTTSSTTNGTVKPTTTTTPTTTKPVTTTPVTTKPATTTPTKPTSTTVKPAGKVNKSKAVNKKK